MLKDEFINTRIEHIDRVREAYIMWDKYPIAKLVHEYSSISGEFDWLIIPDWDTWEEAEKHGFFGGISGIDETLRKDMYIRRYNPSFVTQRTIPDGRGDLPRMLKSLGLRHNDLFEVLCRSHGVCGNDYLYVSRTTDKIIDVDDMGDIRDIPDFDTSDYGWLK